MSDSDDGLLLRVGNGDVADLDREAERIELDLAQRELFIEIGLDPCRSLGRSSSSRH